MKFDKRVIQVNLVLGGLMLLIGGLSLGAAGMGLAMLLLVPVNLVLYLISLVSRKKIAARTSLLCLGLAALIGFALCTVPIHY